MDLVTVAVAAYNVEKYIEQMIESILHQTYSNLEILIVNDGSTDQTLELCEKYQDNRIRIITKENGGLSTARQVALDNASGKYISFVDGDDVLYPDYVESMINAIMQKSADIAVCEYKEFLTGIDDNGCIIKLMETAEDVVQVTRKSVAIDFNKHVQALKLADSWNKMYSVAFLRGTGVKFALDKKYNGTDLMFNHRVYVHCPKYCVVHKTLLHYRLTPNSRVRRKDKDLQAGFMMIFDTLLTDMEMLGYDECAKEQVYLIYLDKARAALADRFANSDTYRIFSKHYNANRKLHFDFVQKNFSGVKINNPTRGMKLFLMLLKMPFAWPMHIYMSLRKKHIEKELELERSRNEQ